jgi:hypothetical protein
MRNRIQRTYLMGLSVLLTFSSCTEEIDVDLNAADPQVVIEGKVTTSGASIVKIARSVNFDQANDFPEVRDAFVELTDDQGNSEILTESSPGTYISSNIVGTVGNTYSLLVQSDGKTLSSMSRIPSQVPFDSIVLSRTTGSIVGSSNDTVYIVRVRIKDPIDEANYYRFLESINGELSNSYVYNDRLFNGEEVDLILPDFTREIEAGDILKIEMQCIDESVHEYFSSFSNSQGSPGGSSNPANPYTNIIGSDVGYFSAHTSEIKEIIIQ